MTCFVRKNRGITLLGAAFFIAVLGLVSMAGAPFYRHYLGSKKTVATTDHIGKAQQALNAFYQTHKRFPCPAPQTAAIDTATYGKEVANCSANTEMAGLPSGDLGDGTRRAAGRKDIPVRIGALPVRTLGLDDENDTDGHRHRLVYAVTENYASASAPDSMSKGAIFLRDSAGNNATADEGNVIYTVVSPGSDRRGAYNANGQLLAPCPTAALAGENCDGNATFVNTLLSSSNDASKYTNQMGMRAGKLCKSQTKALSGGITPVQLTGLIVGSEYEVISRFYQQVYSVGFSPLFHSSVGFYLTNTSNEIRYVTVLAPDTHPSAVPSGTSVTKTWRFIADSPTIDVGIFIIPNWSPAPAPMVPPELYNPAVTDNLRFIRVDNADNPIMPMQLARVTDDRPPALVWVNPTTNAILGRIRGTYAPGYGAYGAGGAIFHSQGDMNPGRVSHMLGMDEVCTPADYAAGSFVGANNHTQCVGITPQQNVGPNPADPESLDFGFEDGGGINCYEMSNGTCQRPANWPGSGANYVGGGPSWPYPVPSNVPWVVPMTPGYSPAGWPGGGTPLVDTYGGFIAQVGDSSYSDVNANLTILTCGP